MKLLFTDLDGTLLNNDSKISKGTMAFLNNFTAAGNRLVLSSGRPLLSILEVMEEAGLPALVSFLSVTTARWSMTVTVKRLSSKSVCPFPMFLICKKKAEEHGLHIQTYTDDAVVSTANDSEIQFYRKRIHLPLLLAQDYASFLSREPCKMLVIHLTDHDKLLRFRDDIADWSKDKIQAIFSNEMYLELFHTDGGKGNAVKFVCSYFNVPLLDAYAAGDADNDISMLEAAGTGIAMKNASEAIKKHADIITDFDNDNDGLSLLMQRLLD